MPRLKKIKRVFGTDQIPKVTHNEIKPQIYPKSLIYLWVGYIIKEKEMKMLNKEDIEFIKNLSHEMKTQDTRCTAQPYALALMVEETRLVPEGYGDALEAYWDDSTYCDIDDLKESLSEYYGYEEDNNLSQGKIDLLEEVFDVDSFYDLKDSYACDELEINIQYVKKEHIIPTYRTNFFLTEKAYNEHIVRNGHNLNNPKSWGIHLSRNHEMERLYEVIHKIAESY